MLCTCWESGAQNAQPAERGKVCKVVLDPGHGGKDPGCVYRNYYEKDVTLGIAKKLGELIRKNYPDVEVIYTRSTDKYVELAERGKIANRANADLFISIHINAATNQNARGTSTHVMGMDKDGKNLEVAMRENDIIIYEDDYTTKYEGYNPGDPASYIMFSLMQYAYKDQSMMFAEIIQKHFKADLPMPDRGTTQEPFLVLWRTSFPIRPTAAMSLPARGRARRRGRCSTLSANIRARWRAGPMSSCCARPRRSPSGKGAAGLRHRSCRKRGNRTPVSSGRNLTTVYFIMCR